MCSDRHNVWWCDGDAVVYIYDSNRNTVSPSLAVRPRLSQDQQRRGLSVVSTLEVNLEHPSSSSTFLSLSSHLMLSSWSLPPSDEVPGRHDPQCCLFSCWWDAGWLSTAVQRFLRLGICFCYVVIVVFGCRLLLMFFDKVVIGLAPQCSPFLSILHLVIFLGQSVSKVRDHLQN